MAKRYCYKLDKKTQKAKALRKFAYEAMRAEQDAESYARGMGAEDYVTDPNFFAGGVAYLTFHDEKKVDAEVWRAAMRDKSDGAMLYEPNVRIVQMMVHVKKGFKPSDTWNTIFKKKPLSFQDVKHRYNVNQWAQMAHVIVTKNEDKTWRAIERAIGKDDFFDMVRIFPITALKTDKYGKEHATKQQRKAVTAMRRRLRLPVVKVDDVYRIMQCDLEAKDEQGKTIKGENTPTMFPYWNNWYFASDFPCKGDDVTEITIAEYMQAQRDMQRTEEMERKQREQLDRR